MRPRTGLVLTAGGARAAYQAGVLKGIADHALGAGCDFPFPIVTGISAGAINGMILAAHADDFHAGAAFLNDLWANLRSDSVIRTDVTALTKLGARWLRDLSLGGLFGSSRATHLLDSGPLREFLAARLSLDAVNANLAAGKLHAVGLTATSYATGTAITFFDGAREIERWARSSRLWRRERLTLEHVLASASIPVLFPPVKLYLARRYRGRDAQRRILRYARCGSRKAAAHQSDSLPSR